MRIFIPAVLAVASLLALAGSVPTMASVGRSPISAQQRATALFGGPLIRAGRTFYAVPGRGPNLLGVPPKYRSSIRNWTKSHPLHVHYAFHDAAKKKNFLYASDFRGAIWQTLAGKSITKTGRKIVGVALDCAQPAGLKVDHNGLLWAACAGTGTVNMYLPGSTVASLILQASYTSSGTTVQAIPVDVAFDKSGNVYVSNQTLVTESTSQFSISAGAIEIFLASASCGNLPCNFSTPNIVINDPNQNPGLNCPPSVEFCFQENAIALLDTSATGDLYEDFLAIFDECSSASCWQVSSLIGVDKIRDPLTASPVITNVIDNMTWPGGVYTTDHGKNLNVLDQLTGVVTRYALKPFHPIGTFGPMPQNPSNACGATLIGFDKTERQIAVGSEGGAGCNGIVAGDTATNTFLLHENVLFGSMGGEAYYPSDK